MDKNRQAKLLAATDRLAGFAWSDPPPANEEFAALVERRYQEFRGRRLPVGDTVEEITRFLKGPSAEAVWNELMLDILVELRYAHRFRDLTDITCDYVFTLTDAGGQPILAQRAGLPELPHGAWPSPKVQFGPLPLPEVKPPNYYAFVRDVNGPHIAGARLLWWCAAAHAPEQFGYPGDLPDRLLSRLPWWDPINGGTEPSAAMLESIKSCSIYVVGVLQEVAIPRQGGAAEAKRRVEVDTKKETIKIHDINYKVSYEQIIFLREVVDHEGRWISTPELRKIPGLEGARIDRIRKRLPADVLAYTESSSGKGYRFKMEILWCS